MSESNDLVKARQEAAALLGLDPARPMCPADSLRVDLVSTLRLVIDAAGETVLEGGSADIGRLVGAVEQLTKLLPKAATEAPSHREDPREALLKIIMTMRERDADAFEGYDGKVKQVEVLQAEIAQLKAQLAGQAPEDSDVPTVVERVPAPAPAAKVVPLPRAAAPAPAEDMDAVDLRYGFNNTPEPWKEFATDVDGVPLSVRGRKYWGPV